MLLTLGQLVAGALMLLLGGELVVRGASKLALAAKLSPLFVGLTVVSFGTSAPELAVSMLTAWNGQADITLGNVVGSNLFNLLVILGFSAIVVPLQVSRQVVRFDVPVMVGAALLMIGFGYDGAISRIDGLILLAALVGYLAVSFVLGRRKFSADEVEVSDSEAPAWKGILFNMALLSAGIGLLIGGCRLFVDASVVIASRAGMSEAMIGLTIVSVGTSLPELVTSVMASWKGQRSIAIGNAIGSTTLNVLIVLGMTTCVTPGSIPVSQDLIRQDMLVMLAACALTWPLLATGLRVSRMEGAVLVAAYVGYLGYLLSKLP